MDAYKIVIIIDELGQDNNNYKNTLKGNVYILSMTDKNCSPNNFKKIIIINI